MNTRIAASVLMAGLIAAAAPASAQSYNFDLGGGWFNGTAATTTAPGGYTVGFNSSQDSNGGFYIGSNNGLFTTLGSQVLIDPGTGGDSLTLTFSQAITGVNFNFAVEDIFALTGDDSLTLTDSNGTQQIFNATYNGTTELFPEGSVNFTDGTGFTSITITAPEAFVIGVSDVPEPATFALLGAGLVGLGLARKRRA